MFHNGFYRRKAVYVMKDSLKYALIGCGRIAINHIQAAINNNLEIVALCDLIADNMESLLVKSDILNRGVIKRYTNYKQMLDENDFDLVAIATDSGSHAEIALH